MSFLRVFLFLSYASAVWGTALAGMEGSDEGGVVCALLLLGGIAVLVYLRFFRRGGKTILYSYATAGGLSLAGLGLGSATSGEAGIGLLGGVVIGAIAAIVTKIISERRRKRPRTIFLSYRRDDSGEITPRIYARLAERFGADNVFMDLHSIELGATFRQVVRDAVEQSDAFLAIIGRRWSTITNKNHVRRLDVETDLVRIEIETALTSGKKKLLVAPVTVDGASMPHAEELPSSIRELTERSGANLGLESHFDEDMDRLLLGLQQGSAAPFSRTSSPPLAWRWIVLMAGIVLGPLTWPFAEMLSADYRALCCAAIKPDKQIVATGHGSGLRVDGIVRLWDVASGKQLRTLEANNPMALEWSPDGNYLATGSHDGTLRLFGTKGWQVAHTLNGHSGMLDQIAWAPDSRQLATGGDHGAVKIWDAAYGALVHTARPHTDNIEMVDWSPNGQRIASASWDHTVGIVDATNGAVLSSLHGHTSYVTDVAWSHNGHLLASASIAEPYLLIWDLNNPAAPRRLVGHQNRVETLAWSPTAQLLASASVDNTVRIWQPGGEMLHIFDVRNAGEIDLMWSTGGKLLAATHDGGISIWKVETGELVYALSGHQGSYARTEILGWWADDTRLASMGRNDDAVRIWDVPAQRVLQTMEAGILESVLAEF